LRLEHEM